MSADAPDRPGAVLSDRYRIERELGEGGTATVYLARWPKPNPRWTLATGQPFEPYWPPDRAILLRDPPNPDAARTYTIALHPGAHPPYGPIELRFRDPHMEETPGWSNSIASDGEIVFPVMPDELHLRSVRVVPHWVAPMEHAVDEANR